MLDLIRGTIIGTARLRTTERGRRPSVAGEVLAIESGASSRLTDLFGLDAHTTRTVLTDAIRAGYEDGSNYVGGVYPKILTPVVRWGVITAELRSGLAPHGWKPGRDRGLETVISPNGKLAVVAWSGDNLTGSKENVDPSTVAHKGPVSTAAIFRGQTSWDLTVRTVAKQESTGTEVWVLLHRLSQATDEIWWELSRPLRHDGLRNRRKVRHWHTRIPGDPIGYQVREEERTEEEEEGVNVPVARKTDQA